MDIKYKIYTLPKGGGKTTKSVNEFLKDEKDQLLIVQTEEERKNIIENFTISNPNNIIYYNKISQTFFESKLNNINTIIIDDYLNFSAPLKYDIYHSIVELSDANIIIFTTPNITYDKNILEYVKTLNLKKFNFNEKIIIILSTFPLIKFSYNELMFNYIDNFLTHPQAKIIEPNVKENISFNQENKDDFILTQVLGKIYK